MSFLFRAAFWIALVAYFMPPDAHVSLGLTPPAQAAPSLGALDVDAVYAEAAQLCIRDPQLCAAGVDMLDAAQDLAVDGLDALARELDRDAAEPAGREDGRT